MKKEIFLLAVICILAVFLAGCGEKTVVEQKSTVESSTAEKAAEPSTKETAKTATAEPKKAATPDIGALTQAGLDCLKPGVKVCLPVNYVTAQAGDTVGFAFGIANNMHDERRMAIKLSYVKVQQEFGAFPPEANKDYMLNWLAVNDLETYYALQSGEKLSKPILIKVQDLIGPGTETAPAAYVFEIQAQIFEKGFYSNYGGPQQVTVRVK